MVCLFPSQLSVDFRRANTGIASHDRQDFGQKVIPRLRGPCHARIIPRCIYPAARWASGVKRLFEVARAHDHAYVFSGSRRGFSPGIGIQ